MSFERKIEGNTTHVITNKDFMFETEVSAINCDKALRILSTKKIRKIASAENKDRKIYITKHYCTCPLCGKRVSAYVNSGLAKRSLLNKKIAALCDNQLSFFWGKPIKNIVFHQPKKIGDSMKCPHCGFEGIISDKMIGCTIKADQKQLMISCSLRTVFEVLSMDWLSNETLSFNDVHCCETVAFDLQNGAVTVSLNCETKTLCTMPVISSKTLGKNDPWLRMFANKRIFREIKRSFEKMYGVIPFSHKTLTVDNLILLTKFVGYPIGFYRDLPLSIDDEKKLLPEEFESIAGRLHYSENVPSIFSKMNLPKTKSIKRIIFNRPSVLFYEKELERLWNIITNIDLYCDLLTYKTIFALLAYFHIYTGIDVFLIEVQRLKGAVWLQQMLTSNCCYCLCSLGVEYLSSNPTIRGKLLKNDLKDIRYRYGHYYDGSFYFSVPMPIRLESSSMSVVSGFQFSFLATLKDYYNAGKELQNCLDGYSPDHDSQVYIIRKKNKILAAIEISRNHIIQALCRNNNPINSNPLKHAIIVWAECNSYVIDDDVF